MALFHSISGTVSKELVARGQKVNIKEINISNTHSSTTATVDLYINNLVNTYYFMKNISIPAGVSLVLDQQSISFDNSIHGFGLFVKLGAGQVDIIIKD